MSIRMTTAAMAIIAISSMATTGHAIEPLTNQLVPNIAIDPLDLDWLRADDARRTADGLPLRFAVPNEAFITPGNNGYWDRNEAGWLRWQMRISSRGAPHINLAFEHWNMPDSGEMFIASEDGTDLVGPFTSLDNFDHGELWAPVVQGDEIIVTITCSDADRLAIEQQIAITKINVGYRGFGAEPIKIEWIDRNIGNQLVREWFNGMAGSGHAADGDDCHRRGCHADRHGGSLSRGVWSKCQDQYNETPVYRTRAGADEEAVIADFSQQIEATPGSGA